MPTIYQEVEIEVELDDFEDDDLLDECERRGLTFGHKVTPATQLIQQIFEAKQLGKPYENLLNDLFYNTIGRIA